MADFSTWKQENLVKFAFEASQEIADQKLSIRHLESDLKSCMSAYRKLNKSINEAETENRINRGAGSNLGFNQGAGIKE